MNASAKKLQGASGAGGASVRSCATVFVDGRCAVGDAQTTQVLDAMYRLRTTAVFSSSRAKAVPPEPASLRDVLMEIRDQEFKDHLRRLYANYYSG